MKKEIIKPFDLEKAKAGATLRTKDGKPVEIFKWDARGKYPIKGIVIDKKDDKSTSWSLNGLWCEDSCGNFDLIIVEEVEEPKFNIGDWVIWDNKIPCHIDNIYQGKESLMYAITDTNNMTRSYSVKGFDNNAYLWTIQDAKAGDILATKDYVFIFKHKDKTGRSLCKSYCEVIGNSELGLGFDFSINDVYPASNEQRKLLHSKIKKAGYEWDAKKLELKKIKPEFWSDTTGAKLEGFFIGCSSNIHKTNSVLCCTSHNVFATEKQAKSALAMARISQIMANDIENFGGVVTDEEWKNDEWKYVIYRDFCSINTTFVMHNYYFLAFHTEKQCNLFLTKYPQLVKDYLMIPDEETK